MTLDEVVPFGRLLAEYEAMFALTPADFAGPILGCGDGPASFNAEATARGARVMSVDPVYEFPGPEIRRRFDAVVDGIIGQVRASVSEWVWSFHRDPDDLRRHRQVALDLFLADYDGGRADGRYLAAALPRLPFDDGAFDLALCSHLLFLYSAHLSEDFHAASVLEMLRVAREVRVFPLLTLTREPAPHLSAVRQALADGGYASEVVTVGYEFQRGGNQMLRAFRPPAG